MSAGRIAYRYAKALIEIAQEQKVLEDVVKDMSMLHNLTTESREFHLMLKSPIINTEKKVSILKQAFEGKMHQVTLGFINLLASKKREAYVPEMTRSFMEQYDDIRGITKVYLTTPIKPNDSMLQKVHGVLSKASGIKEVDLKTEIDQDILGGFVLRFKDKLYDDSVSSRLRELKAEFDDNEYVKRFRH